MSPYDFGNPVHFSLLGAPSPGGSKVLQTMFVVSFMLLGGNMSDCLVQGLPANVGIVEDRNGYCRSFAENS
jgi:hypothetical protein